MNKHRTSQGSVIKRGIFVVLLLVLLGSSLSPRPVSAGLPVIDVLNIAQNTITAVASNALTTKELALDPIAYAVAKVALQSITKSTVNWINTGFNGSPAFVTDLNSTLLQVSDTYATSFLSELTSNSSIRSPFQTSVAQNVKANYFISTSNDGFFLQNPYTLNQVSPNDTAFLQGDFSQGGWDAWLSAITHPANNPFGAELLQRNALSQVTTNAKDKTKFEVQSANGFLSFRGTNCQKPAANQASTGTNASTPSSGASAGTQAKNQTSSSANASTPKSTNKVVALTNIDPCLFNSILTPGSTIAPALNKAIGAGTDALVSADEINEIVGALFGQLVNQVVGPSGLSGVSQPSSGGGRSYIDQSTDPTQTSDTEAAGYANSVTSNYVNVIQSQMDQVTEYQSNWQRINGAAASAKSALTGSTCTDIAQSRLSSQVNPVITQATTALANAGTSITSLSGVKNQVISSVSSASATQLNAVSTASDAYQALLASPTMPTVTDIEYSEDQSADTGTSTPSSLYTQMTQIAASPCT